MIELLLVLVLGNGGGLRVAPIEVDLIEFNHRCSADDCLQFDQIILWEWSPDYRRYNAQHWFLPRSLGEHPVKVGEFYQCSMVRLDGGRAVYRAKLFRETWTLEDPERENIKVFPVEFRGRVFSCSR
jgi:hypothetical protein